MTRLRHLALAGAFALAACGGKSEPATTTPVATTDTQPPAPVTPAEPALPTIPSEPVAAPDSLLAEISIGDPNGQLSQLGAFADAIQPGAGAMLTPQTFLQGLGSTVGVPNLVGVDMQKPVYALVHDEQTVPSAWLLVVPVADQAAIEQSVTGGAGAQVLFHGGYAAIGTVEALAAGAPYALSARIGAETVPEPHVMVRMPVLMARYGQMLGAQLQAEMGPGAEPFLSALQQVQTLEASLVVDKDAAGVEMSAAVTPGGSLSTFLAAQKPAAFTLVPQIGTKDWPVFAAGYLDMGQLAPVFASSMAEHVGPLADDLQAMLASLSGEMVWGADGGDDELETFAMVWQVSDAEAASKLAAASVDAFQAKMKEDGAAEGELDITIRKNALKARGGALHQITYKPKKDLPKERRAELTKKMGKRGATAYFGVVGDRVIAVYGKNARQRARALTRAKPRARGKNAELDKVLEDAKTRGESFVMAMDIAAIAKAEAKAKGPAKDIEPMIIGFKAEGDVAKLRVTMPAAQVREAQGIQPEPAAPAATAQ